MKYMMESIWREEAKKQLPAIRLEIDYELVTLHDALQEDDRIQMIRSKEKLEQLRIQLLHIEHGITTTVT
ncbi:MAG TPA: hypothetical protein VK144_04560 [Bacillota bacterium]|nr:hypothetical protein [Bacillota bacterium]